MLLSMDLIVEIAVESCLTKKTMPRIPNYLIESKVHEDDKI
jgi:hypothetical protein